MLAELKVSSSHSKMLPSLELREKQFLKLDFDKLKTFNSLFCLSSKFGSLLFRRQILSQFCMLLAKEKQRCLRSIVFILIVRFVLYLLCISSKCFLFQIFPGVHVFCFGQFSWHCYFLEESYYCQQSSAVVLWRALLKNLQIVN